MQIFLTEEKKAMLVCVEYISDLSQLICYSRVSIPYLWTVFSAALIIELVYITLKWSSSFDCNPSVFSSRAQCIQLVLYIR
jgi:hypothetical protein